MYGNEHVVLLFRGNGCLHNTPFVVQLLRVGRKIPVAKNKRAGVNNEMSSFRIRLGIFRVERHREISNDGHTARGMS